MLNIFRTNQLATTILLLLYIIVLHVSVFVTSAPAPTAESSGVFSEWVLSKIGDSVLWNQIAVWLLLLFQAFLINATALEHRLQNESTLFPGLFYVLFCSLFPDFLYLSPALIGNTFFIIAVGQMMQCYKKTSTADRLFNIGFWLGIGGFFYFSSNFLVLWAFIGVTSLRAFRLRETFQILFGLSTAWLLVGTIYYVTGNWPLLWENTAEAGVAFYDYENADNTLVLIKGGIVGLLVLLAVFSLDAFTSKKVMMVQRKVIVLYRALFIIALTMLFQANMSLQHLLLFGVPLSFLIAFWFINMKRSTAESLHFIIFVAVVFYQFSGKLFNVGF